MDYRISRPMTSKIIEMMDCCEIDTRTVADMCLRWMSESDVKEMMQSEDLDEDAAEAESED